MPFNAATADLIRQWRAQQAHKISIRFRATADARSKELEQFLQELAECGGSIELVTETGEPGEGPAILVAPNVVYQALPQDRELAPFLRLLSYAAGGAPPPDEASRNHLAEVSLPAELTVFIAAACPHCPEVVRKLSPLPFHQPLLRLNIVDGLLFPELSDAAGVRSVPAVLLDRQFRWTGSIDMQELLETLVRRDAAFLPVDTFKNLLKEGHASQLATMMLERDEIFPAVIDLITHPEWSVRLGAVVLMEEIAEANPELAQTALTPLWERFDAADATVKGDILYLVGLAGSEEWAPRLRSLLGRDLSDDLRESVQEALARW